MYYVADEVKGVETKSAAYGNLYSDWLLYNLIPPMMLRRLSSPRLYNENVS